MSDEIPDPLKALADMVQAMASMATGTRAYYVALVSEGFSDDQALHLTIGWQTAVISASMKS